MADAVQGYTPVTDKYSSLRAIHTHDRSLQNELEEHHKMVTDRTKRES